MHHQRADRRETSNAAGRQFPAAAAGCGPSCAPHRRRTERWVQCCLLREAAQVFPPCGRLDARPAQPDCAGRSPAPRRATAAAVVLRTSVQCGRVRPRAANSPAVRGKSARDRLGPNRRGTSRRCSIERLSRRRVSAMTESTRRPRTVRPDNTKCAEFAGPWRRFESRTTPQHTARPMASVESVGPMRLVFTAGLRSPACFA